MVDCVATHGNATPSVETYTNMLTDMFADTSAYVSVVADNHSLELNSFTCGMHMLLSRQ